MESKFGNKAMHNFYNTNNLDRYKNVYEDTASRIQSVVNLFYVWKGSVTKLLWLELFVFLFCYYVLALLYWHVLILDETSAQIFEMICIYCQKGTTSIRTILIFLTGFYVTQVLTRYWDQFISLPWPDRIAFKLVAAIPGRSLYHQNLRRTIIRYVNLSTILVLRVVASQVHERFPTYESMVNANLLLPHEKERLETIDKTTPHETTFIPIMWAVNLIQKGEKDGKLQIKAPVYANLISAFDYLEDRNRSLFNHGWINFPLAYTQVATLTIFFYFLACLFGRQYLYPREFMQQNITISPNVEYDALNATFATTGPYANHSPDMYIPFFTIFEFVSFYGWMKVADELLNPFGEDDEDFQINYLIDRNLQVSYLIVNEAMHELEMLNDPFLGRGTELPTDLPFENEDDGCCSGIGCFSRKQPRSESAGRKSARCQSASSSLRNLNKSSRSRCRSSGSKIKWIGVDNKAPLEISVID